MLKRLKNIFYLSKLGALYFDLLLWYDRKFNRPKYLTPKEVVTAIREYSQVTEGVNLVKREINNLALQSNVKEALSTIEDLVPLAEDIGGPKEQYVEALKELVVKKGDKDIKNDLDKAKMIQDRIQDYKELHKDKEKRTLLRAIRKAKLDGIDTSLMEQEFKEKYGVK